MCSLNMFQRRKKNEQIKQFHFEAILFDTPIKRGSLLFGHKLMPKNLLKFLAIKK